MEDLVCFVREQSKEKKREKKKRNSAARKEQLFLSTRVSLLYNYCVLLPAQRHIYIHT